MQLLRVFGSRTVIVRRQGLLEKFVDQANNNDTALHTRTHTDKTLFCLQSRSLALEKKRNRYVLSLEGWARFEELDRAEVGMW